MHFRLSGTGGHGFSYFSFPYSHSRDFRGCKILFSYPLKNITLPVCVFDLGSFSRVVVFLCCLALRGSVMFLGGS